MPDSVTSIGSWAFEYCSGLTSVTIGNSVIRIGWSAFSDCTGLTSIIIGNSVTNIEQFVFSNCTRLTIINFNGTIAEWSSIKKGGGWNDNVPSTCKVVCTDGTVSI